MDQQLSQLKETIQQSLREVATLADLEQVRTKFLGKKGPIQDLMKFLKDATPDERPVLGQAINTLKQYATDEVERLHQTLQASAEGTQLATETLDITLPGKEPRIGGKHLLTQVLDEMIDILVGMGFSVQYGPHVESDYYNFEALNIGKDHPARDMQDTFYVDEETVLRTHTSNIQARIMEAHRPPIRIIAPGKVFRNEDVSARSHVLFHQLEGVYIDRNVSFADLLYTLDEFLKKWLGPDTKIRTRPSYFPFVEPGCEVDVSCTCGGKGCTICKGTGWLEILGAGMVHPKVLAMSGIDPEEFTGFAWGMGLERLVMIRQGIPDIRMFLQDDLRFLKQFKKI